MTTEKLISMNGINVETRIIWTCNVEICNVTMKLCTCYNTRYEYANKHTSLVILEGTFVVGTSAKRARTSRTASWCFAP